MRRRRNPSGKKLFLVGAAVVAGVAVLGKKGVTGPPTAEGPFVAPWNWPSPNSPIGNEAYLPTPQWLSDG